MAYKLIEVEYNDDGNGDYHRTKAVSNNTYWGCNFYDNAKDAMKNFG